MTVRVDDVDRIALAQLAGATTGHQRYLHVGIDHYDAQTTSETVIVAHASVAYGQTGWLGPPAPSPPANTVLPAITGTAQQGQTLQSSTGTWKPDPYAYQWRRCNSSGAGCADIAGATLASYTLVAADVGSTVRSQVTASNAAGAGTPRPLRRRRWW